MGVQNIDYSQYKVQTDLKYHPLKNFPAHLALAALKCFVLQSVAQNRKSTRRSNVNLTPLEFPLTQPLPLSL